jgi:hypothetical protein
MAAVNVRVLRLTLAVCGGLATLAVGAAHGAVPSPDPSPVAGPTPDPFPAHVQVRPAPPVVVQRPVTRTQVPSRQVARRPTVRHAATRRSDVVPRLRIPDHAPPVAIGAFVTTDSRRRVPLALVLALGALTLASGALVGTVARVARR